MSMLDMFNACLGMTPLQGVSCLTMETCISILPPPEKITLIYEVYATKVIIMPEYIIMAREILVLCDLCIALLYLNNCIITTLIPTTVAPMTAAPTTAIPTTALPKTAAPTATEALTTTTGREENSCYTA